MLLRWNDRYVQRLDGQQESESNVGKNSEPSQDRELEKKRKQDQEKPSSSVGVTAPLDIMKEVHKSNLPNFSEKHEGKVVES